MSKTKEDIYRDKLIEYFKPYFPYSNIEEKVDTVIWLKEEADVIHKAMQEYADQCVKERDAEILEWIKERGLDLVLIGISQNYTPKFVNEINGKKSMLYEIKQFIQQPKTEEP